MKVLLYSNWTVPEATLWEEKLFIAVPEGPETFVKKSAEDLDLLLCSTFVHKQVWLLSSLKNTEGYFHLVQGKNRVNSTSLWSWSGILCRVILNNLLTSFCHGNLNINFKIMLTRMLWLPCTFRDTCFDMLIFASWPFIL